jgi:hypothetical protein
MRDVKKKLDSGTLKGKDVEETYRVYLMSLDIRAMENQIKMNKLPPESDIITVKFSSSLHTELQNESKTTSATKLPVRSLNGSI